MTVLIPTKKWRHAGTERFETRLRHAPLESFLRSRGRKWVQSSESRVSDNLACATIFFVDQALNACTPDGNGLLDATHHAAVGQAACAVSHGLALLIQEANSWRIAALIGTARILAPHIGPDAAAHLSATCARDYARAQDGPRGRPAADQHRSRRRGGEQQPGAGRQSGATHLAEDIAGAVRVPWRRRAAVAAAVGLFRDPGGKKSDSIVRPLVPRAQANCIPAKIR